MPKPAAHRFTLFTLSLLVFSVGMGTRTAADSQSAQHADSAAHDAVVPKPPLYLEARASVRGALRGPFLPDMTLQPGAQIALQARTSNAAHVYMLHCDVHAVLSVFPDAGGIDFRSDQWVSLPAADMPIRLGSEPGTETVYVVATRDALEQNDPRLARWLIESVKQPQAARCDTQLTGLLAGRATARALPPTAATPPPRKLPYALRGIDLSKANSPTARAFAESDGVVVLRFAYTIAAHDQR